MKRLSSVRNVGLAVTGAMLLALVLPSATSLGTAIAQASCGGSCTTLSPTQGPPGTTVAATGSQWPAGDQIQAIWGSTSGPYVGSPVTVSSSGTFTLSFTVPSNAALGNNDVFFWDMTEQYFETASTPFDVTPPVTVTSVATWGFFLQNKDTSYKAAEHVTSNFTPGEQIEYVPYVKNTASSAVTETFRYLVTAPSGSQVYSWSGSVSVAPGTNGYILPSDIPNNPPGGTYTITVTVSLNGSSTSNKTTFTVAGPSRTLGTGLITSNPYPFGHTSTTGQCTYGTDQIFDSYTSELYYPNGKYLPNFGNAYQWATAAVNKGWTVPPVSSAPQLNSIVVFPANYISGEPNGHVAWVTKITKVTGGYNITVAEMNGTVGPGYFDYYTYPPSQDKNARYILATDTSSQTWAQVTASASTRATGVTRMPT